MESLVIDLEYAKKLKEIGIVEKVKFKYAKPAISFNHITGVNIYSDSYTLLDSIGIKVGIYIEDYSAFLAEELIKILPIKIFDNDTLAYTMIMSLARDSTKDFIVGYYRYNMKECYVEVRDSKLSNALAKVAIILKERGEI